MALLNGNAHLNFVTVGPSDNIVNVKVGIVIMFCDTRHGKVIIKLT